MTEAEPRVTQAGEGELEFACPRCARPSRQRFYGPCPSCRDELGATMGQGPSDAAVQRAPIEPKMNVVPNFVATKE